MKFDAALFLCALGLAFMLESCLYALFPDGMRRMLTHMAGMSTEKLRSWGLCGLGIGLAIVTLGRWVG